MINIVLYEPEIPQNTGNIARTCACTGAKLHLIRPFMFEISEKTVKRAGLDYWDKVDIEYHDNISCLFDKYNGSEFYYLSSKVEKKYTDVKFNDGCFLIFGPETRGLPKELLENGLGTALKIPMNGSVRCLNLSNSVSIVLYEALRQNGFEGLQ